jgi:hypothetical protein
VDNSSGANHGVVDGAKLTEDHFGNANGAYVFNNNQITIIAPWGASHEEFSLTWWMKPTPGGFDGNCHGFIGYSEGGTQSPCLWISHAGTSCYLVCADRPRGNNNGLLNKDFFAGAECSTSTAGRFITVQHSSDPTTIREFMVHSLERVPPPPPTLDNIALDKAMSQSPIAVRGNDAQPDTGTCSKPVCNFITVQHANYYSTICEVEAMDVAGDYVPLNNVARGKVATQPTRKTWGGTAVRAIDGTTARQCDEALGTYTQNGAPEWWQVDLGGVHSSISTVSLHCHRTDCCQDRLVDAIIIIRDTDDFSAGAECSASTAGRFITGQHSGDCSTTCEFTAHSLEQVPPPPPPPTLDNISTVTAASFVARHEFYNETTFNSVPLYARGIMHMDITARNSAKSDPTTSTITSGDGKVLQGMYEYATFTPTEYVDGIPPGGCEYGARSDGRDGDHLGCAAGRPGDGWTLMGLRNRPAREVCWCGTHRRTRTTFWLKEMKFSQQSKRRRHKVVPPGRRLAQLQPSPAIYTPTPCGLW